MKYFTWSVFLGLVLTSIFVFGDSKIQTWKTYYWNINSDSFIEIKESMYNEISTLKKENLDKGLKVVGQLYEYLNENNLDLGEEDFWDLLYEYLEWGLTIKKLKEDFSVPKELLSHISNELLFGQEIRTAELEKKAKQLEAEAQIKEITAEIKEENRKQEEENRKQEEENRKQEDIKKVKKTLDNISNKLWD